MSQTVATADDTCSTAYSSSIMTLTDVNLNAVNVFKPIGSSPIAADICLLGLDNNSVDKFVTPEQSPVYNTDDPSED